jgi:hypothetical protein
MLTKAVSGGNADISEQYSLVSRNKRSHAYEPVLPADIGVSVAPLFIVTFSALSRLIVDSGVKC